MLLRKGGLHTFTDGVHIRTPLQLRKNMIEFMQAHKDDLDVENMDLVLPELLEGDLTGGSASPLTSPPAIEMREGGGGEP
mmetsp:Transcript_36630/g.98107  ORF Transcript_36630/g.98107 Transcript_36630/m.98107 type:complete len:80 (+) Transcript_36630:856-1095(+)